MRTILGQIRQYKKDSILTPLFIALEVAMEVMLPFVTILIIDEDIQEGNMGRVYAYGGIMVIMTLASLMAGAPTGKYAASVPLSLACNPREGIYDKIQTFSFSNIDKFSIADLVTRVIMDVANIQNVYQMRIRIAVRSPLIPVRSMVMSFMISLRLSMILLAAIVFLTCVLGCSMMMAKKTFDTVFKRYDDLNANIQENAPGIRVVKAYMRKEYENTRFAGAVDNLCRLFVKAENILAPNNPVMMLAIYNCILSISWFDARSIVGGTMTIEELTFLFSCVMSIMMSLMMLSMVFMMITMSSSSIRGIEGVFIEEPDTRNPEQPMTEVVDDSIDFSKVGFSYGKSSGKQALTGIGLHIRAGETLEIIGGTNSGETSLVSLISRLYDVDTDSMCVGGRDVRDYDLEILRDAVPVVLQKNVLFSGTILENLRRGNETTTGQECMDARRVACVDEFIQQLPEKYHTLIEWRDTNVSGEQKQKLCTTEALLKNPRVLILDNSINAVGTATDARIKSAFTTVIPGTTKIIISQRISSVQHTGHILVMDNGRINGFDTHEELAASNEICRKIYKSQSKGGGDFDQIQSKGGETEPARTRKECVA